MDTSIESFTDTFEKLLDTYVQAKTPVLKEKEYEFSFDVLAYACQQYEQGCAPFTIIQEFSDLSTENDTPATPVRVEIEQQYRDLANTIRDYFSKKHMMRALTGEFISEWMQKVNLIIDRPRSYTFDLLKVVSTLPRFYKTNIELESMMKTAWSVPTDSVNNDYVATGFTTTATFEKKIASKTKNVDEIMYYWKTEDKYLVRARVSKNDPSNCAWEALSKMPSIKIKFNKPYYKKLAGYNFNVYIMSEHCEVTL